MTNERFLKRTIFIGLGGTGKLALLHAKRKYIETFGEIPPLVKFLLLDTTRATGDHRTAYTPEGKKEQVRLLPSEVLHIEARGASMLPTANDEIREWFPPRADLKANIIAGAGQIRALGRLALFANARTVYDGLRDLLSQARDYKAERNRGGKYVYQAYSPYLTVCVASSLAGGTGAGIFLDVGMILRDMLKDEEQLFAYLLLPDIYVNRPGTQNVDANAYAALCELDHYMSLRDAYRYQFGGREIEVRKKPFDMVFLLNRENRAGKVFNKIEDLGELIGLGMFLMSGPLGKDQADVFDNIVMQLAEQQGVYHDKKAHYASFGAVELRFCEQRVRGDRTRKVAERLAQTLLGGEEPWDPVDVRALLDRVSSLSSPQLDARKKPDYSGSPQEDRKRFDTACSSLDSLLNELRVQAGKELAGTCPFRERLRELVGKALFTHRRGLGSIQLGLEKLRSELEDRAKAMEQRRDEAREKQNDFRKKLEAAFEPSTRGRFLRRFNKQEEPTEPKFGKSERDLLVSRAQEVALAEAQLMWVKESLAEVRSLENDVQALLETVRSRAWMPNQTDSSANGSWPEDSAFLRTLPAEHAPAAAGSDAEDSSLQRAWEALSQRGLEALLAEPAKVLEEVCCTGRATGFHEWLQRVADASTDDPLRREVERCARRTSSLLPPGITKMRGSRTRG